MQSDYLCIILHVKHKKIVFIAVLTWFLLLGKFQDGDNFWWGHRPPAALSLIYFVVQVELKCRTAGEGEFDNAEQPY